jgi:subtilisin family serine protease
VVDSCGQVKGYVPSCTTSAVVVFGAGNFADEDIDPVCFPANMPQVVAVGAVDSTGAKWDYSSYGTALDVVAPSGNDADNYGILTLGDQWTMDQMGYLGWNPNNQDWFPYPADDWDYTANMGGTSGACPQVAGIAALILARRPNFFSHPQFADTVSRVVKYIIDSSAVDIGAPGKDDSTGYGIANAYRALLSVIRGDLNNDAGIDALDIGVLIDMLFADGHAVLDDRTADFDCDSLPTALDLGDLIDYVFNNGPAPRICFEYAMW